MPSAEELKTDLALIDQYSCPPKYTSPPVEAHWKTVPEDFVVDERWQPEVSEGEHHVLMVRKRLQNTQWVADSLASFAGVRQVDIGFFGLKDRHAVTSQWFSVYMGKREAPDWRAWMLDGCEILQIGRYPRKLRRGDHAGNEFRIVLRQLTAGTEVKAAVELALRQLGCDGFPNYFGAQRFGFDHNNLAQFERNYCQHSETAATDNRDSRGKIPRAKGRGGRSRGRRINPMYVSAARAHLFNCLLALRQSADVARALVAGDEPYDNGVDIDAGKAAPSGVMPGGPVRAAEADMPAVSDLLRQKAWANYTDWLEALHALGERDTSRALWITPTNLSWDWNNGVLVVSFGLPPGAYASVALSQVAHLIQDSRPRNETTSLQ